METEILKSKWLHFGFFRLLVNYIFKYDETLKIFSSKISDLELSYKNLLDINSDLVTALSEQSSEIKNLSSIVESLKYEPLNQKPSDLIRSPSRIMDKIRDEYNSGTE